MIKYICLFVALTLLSIYVTVRYVATPSQLPWYFVALAIAVGLPLVKLWLRRRNKGMP